MGLFDFVCLASAGVAVLVSWVGWGAVVYRGLGLVGRVRVNAAMLAAWGMALMTILGGVSAMLHVVSVPAVGLLTLIGVVVALWEWWRSRGLGRKGEWLWAVPVVVLAAIVFAGAVRSTAINPGDDKLAYMVFPKQMLESGTLIAPFNLRRLGAYGGHQFLQAQVMATTQGMWGWAYLRAGDLCLTHGLLLDAGLCTILASGLVYGMSRGRGRRNRPLALLAAAIVLLMPVPRANTQSEMSAVVLFLVAAGMLPMLWRRQSGWREAVVLGMLTAAIASLRMNFVGGVLATLALFAIWPSRMIGAPWSRRIMKACVASAILAAGVMPWAVVLFKSSGTPFYPLIHGNQAGAVSFLEAPRTWGQRLQWALDSLAYPQLLLLLAPMILAIRLRLKGLMSLYLGAMAMVMVTAWFYTNVSTVHLHRYYWPMAVACALGTLAVVIRRWERMSRLEKIATLLLLVALPSSGIMDLSEVFRTTYPLAMIAGYFLLAVAQRRNELTGDLLRAAALLLGWGVSWNAGVMFDPGARLLCLIGIGGIGWIVCTVGRHWVRAWAAGIGMVSCVFLMRGFIAVSGGFPAVLGGLAVAGVGVMAWMLVTGVHRRRVTGPLLLCVTTGLVVYAMLASGGILLDGMRAAWFFAALAAVAWLAASVAEIKVRAVAISVALVLVTSWIVLTGMISTREAPPRGITLQKTYQAAQECIPPGAVVLVISSDPAMLNFSRNTLYTADNSLEYISRPPHIPVNGSLEAFREYWREVGVRYVIYSPADLESDGVIAPAKMRQNFADAVRGGELLFESSEVSAVDWSREEQ